MSTELAQSSTQFLPIFGALTLRQNSFVNHYLEQNGNGTLAAKLAGFPGDDNQLAVTAHRLLRNRKVIAELQRRLGKSIASADEVLARLTKHSRADLTQVLNNDGSFDLRQARRRGTSDLLKKLKVKRRIERDKDGNETEYVDHEFELHDAQAATKTLAQFHGLLDRGDSGTTNININIEKIELGGVLREALSSIIDITPGSE